MSKLQTLLEDQKKLKKEFSDKARKEFNEAIKELFAAVPELKALKWQQYTPYFNDGDECVFGMHGVTYANTKDTGSLSYGEYDGDEENVWVCEGHYGLDKLPLSQEKKDAIAEFDTLINDREMLDVLEAAFDNHVEVTVTEDGIDVEEYEHD